MLFDLFYRGGVVVEEDKSGFSHIQQQAKKLENWEELLMLHHQQQQQLQQAAPTGSIDSLHHDVKQENSSNSYHVFGCNTQVQTGAKPTWPHMIPVSSPNSCVTSLSSNMLDFSNSNTNGRHPPPDRSSEVLIRVVNFNMYLIRCMLRLSFYLLIMLIATIMYIII